MRVLVNALPLRRGGGVTYLRQQLAALARVAPELDLHTLVSPWTEADGLPGTVETVPLRSVATRFAYEQVRLPFRSCDLLYCAANFGPTVLASRAPTVLAIHNANYYGSGLALPETRRSRPPLKVRANHLAMRRASAVVAVSHALAEEAVAAVPAVADKIHVLSCGRPVWPAGAAPVTRLPERYLVTVASRAPHKRVTDVVDGWARSLDLAGTAIPLVVVGDLAPAQRAAHRATAGRHQAGLVHTGPIQDRATLRSVYAGATAMVSMSALESLSLTPIEAGSVGCPIVLSDLPVHQEVALGHAVFVPVGDPEALAKALCAGYPQWRPGSRPWSWPTGWDDNARELVRVFESIGRPVR